MDKALEELPPGKISPDIWPVVKAHLVLHQRAGELPHLENLLCYRCLALELGYKSHRWQI